MPLKHTDDFDWPTYTDAYARETEEVIAARGDFLIRGWSVGPDGLPIIDGNIGGIWKAIYEIAFQLKPATIFECGCGSMYHLRNLSLLLPEAKIYGCDLLVSQLHFGAVKWKIGHDILKHVRILDFTAPDATDDLGHYDLVYTQSVIMHLGFEKAVRFVKNMVTISGRHMLMLENPQWQDFDAVWRAAGVLDQFVEVSIAGAEQMPTQRPFLFSRKT